MKSCYAPVYTVKLVRERTGSNRKVTQAILAAKVFKDFFSGYDREGFAVLMLDTQNKIIGINLVSLGSLNTTIVHPREVFKPAILASANTVIVGHNHPSGEVGPSPHDIALTTVLRAVGEMLDIPVLDHIIVTDETTEYYSFSDKGLFVNPK